VSSMESSCLVSGADGVTPAEPHTSVVSSSMGDRHKRGSHATHRSLVEPATAGAVLRPTLMSSRKGHGHRHRRAVRRASSGVSCAVPLSLVEVDPREPQSVLSESALLTSRQNSCSHYAAEAVALQMLNASRATVISPAHSDLLSLSSYKETSPESEAAAPSSVHLLELRSLSEARRRSGLSSLSCSRDSLEMYKNRIQRKLSFDGMILSESAIVHAAAEPLSSVSNSCDVVLFNSTDHMVQADIASASLQRFYATAADNPIPPDNETSNVSIHGTSISSVQPETRTTTSCDDTADRACGGCSPVECKSESSNTLTPVADVSASTVRQRTGKNAKSKSESSSRKLSSLFYGDSTGSEVNEDANGPAVEASKTDLMALEWLFSTDSEDSPLSGMYLYFLPYSCRGCRVY